MSMFGFRIYTDSFILDLKDQVTWLREQMLHERRRAEQAIDELLRIRVAAGPVAPPAPPTEAERRVERLLSDPEFTSVGSLE